MDTKHVLNLKIGPDKQRLIINKKMSRLSKTEMVLLIVINWTTKVWEKDTKIQLSHNKKIMYCHWLHVSL